MSLAWMLFYFSHCSEDVWYLQLFNVLNIVVDGMLSRSLFFATEVLCMGINTMESKMYITHEG